MLESLLAERARILVVLAPLFNAIKAEHMIATVEFTAHRWYIQANDALFLLPCPCSGCFGRGGCIFTPSRSHHDSPSISKRDTTTVLRPLRKFAQPRSVRPGRLYIVIVICSPCWFDEANEMNTVGTPDEETKSRLFLARFLSGLRKE